MEQPNVSAKTSKEEEKAHVKFVSLISSLGQPGPIECIASLLFYIKPSRKQVGLVFSSSVLKEVCEVAHRPQRVGMIWP